MNSWRQTSWGPVGWMSAGLGASRCEWLKWCDETGWSIARWHRWDIQVTRALRGQPIVVSLSSKTSIRKQCAGWWQNCLVWYAEVGIKEVRAGMPVASQLKCSHPSRLRCVTCVGLGYAQDEVGNPCERNNSIFDFDFDDTMGRSN
jgi:hypothetical protein